MKASPRRHFFPNGLAESSDTKPWADDQSRLPRQAIILNCHPKMTFKNRQWLSSCRGETLAPRQGFSTPDGTTKFRSHAEKKRLRLDRFSRVSQRFTINGWRSVVKCPLPLSKWLKCPKSSHKLIGNFFCPSFGAPRLGSPHSPLAGRNGKGQPTVELVGPGSIDPLPGGHKGGLGRLNRQGGMS